MFQITPPNVKYHRAISIVEQGDLPNDTTLMLSFHTVDNTFKPQYSVCWVVGTFPANRPGQMPAFYNNQLVFVYPNVDPETNIVYPQTWREVDIGQKTSLEKKEDGVHVFTTPVAGQQGAVVVENKTEEDRDLVLGFASDPTPTPILYFDAVSPDADVLTQFTPIVSAYVTSQYQQGQIMKNGVEVKPIWTAEMSSLKETTVLIFSRDKTTGEFYLGPAVMI
ncbi:hypothetical protein FRB91_002976 [Serendipita sp. 411]|nr:hypothetical protein FRB91_002976 [Serendipita sp. 411]